MTKTEILNRETLTLTETIKIPFVERYILKDTKIRALGYSKEGTYVKVRVINFDTEIIKSKLPYATHNDVYCVNPSALR